MTGCLELVAASERLAKQLEEESDAELRSSGGQDETASLELARLLDIEERVRHAHPHAQATPGCVWLMASASQCCAQPCVRILNLTAPIVGQTGKGAAETKAPSVPTSRGGSDPRWYVSSLPKRCARAHTHTHTCVHTNEHIRVCLCVKLRKSCEFCLVDIVGMRFYKCVCARARMDGLVVACVRESVHPCMFLFMHECMHACVHRYTYMHACVHRYTYTVTYNVHIISGDVPRVGSDEYRRRLHKAASDAISVVGAGAPAKELTPPPNCLSRKIVVVGDRSSVECVLCRMCSL